MINSYKSNKKKLDMAIICCSFVVWKRFDFFWGKNILLSMVSALPIN